MKLQRKPPLKYNITITTAFYISLTEFGSIMNRKKEDMYGKINTHLIIF